MLSKERRKTTLNCCIVVLKYAINTNKTRVFRILPIRVCFDPTTNQFTPTYLLNNESYSRMIYYKGSIKNGEVDNVVKCSFLKVSR